MSAREIAGQIFAWTVFALLMWVIVSDCVENGDHSALAVMADRTIDAAQRFGECPMHVTVDEDEHCLRVGIGR